MIIPPIWIGHHEIELGAYPATCPTCGVQVLRNAIIEYSCFTYLFIFGFVTRLEVLGTCRGCNQPLRLPSSQISKPTRRALPYLHRFGCLSVAIAALVASCIIILVKKFG
jgi:hypothetical protein